MKKETKESSVKLVEALNGEWAVRWNINELEDSENKLSYEEHIFNYIPTIEDIQQVIITWFNKQTDGIIKYGFRWKDIQVILTDESKFNYKAITDEAARREEAIKLWDEQNPELAGKNSVMHDGIDGPVFIPTGRPNSLLPVTLKLGESNTPENFYVFETLEELQEFFSAGVDHLIGAYGAGWYKISTFDWSPYVEGLKEL